MRTDHGPGLSGPGRSLRRFRVVAVLAIGIAIGVAMMATPVSGHVGTSVTHLWNAHLKSKTDARYYTKAQSNTRYYTKAQANGRYLGSGAKAADADELDGLDSAAFLRSDGTAADAELLDGLDSAQFVQGNGRALGRAIAIPVNSFTSVISIAGVLNLTYFCGAGGGVLVLANASSEAMDFVVEIGSDSVHLQLASGNATELTPPAVDSIQIHGYAPSVGVVTGEVAVARRTNDCHAQAQVVITR